MINSLNKAGFRRAVGRLAGILLAVVAIAGCSSNDGAVEQEPQNRPAAVSPHEKTHRDQLSRMRQEDAKAAGQPEKRREGPLYQERRRSGQGVVDQPIR